jgi:hypothetical protein
VPDHDARSNEECNVQDKNCHGLHENKGHFRPQSMRPSNTMSNTNMLNMCVCGLSRTRHNK